MRKLIYTLIVLFISTYIVALALSKLFWPTFGQVAGPFPIDSDIRPDNGLFAANPTEYYLFNPRLRDDYRIIKLKVKISSVSEAKAVAMRHLRQEPRFREAFQDLLARFNRAMHGGPWTEEELLSEMVKVVDLIQSADTSNRKHPRYYWLVRVVSPKLSKELVIPRPILQELLINADNGDVRPMIPWDRWGKPDTGKLYPPRIPQNRRETAPSHSGTGPIPPPQSP